MRATFGRWAAPLEMRSSVDDGDMGLSERCSEVCAGLLGGDAEIRSLSLRGITDRVDFVWRGI